jgi:hypothetical protein
VRFVVALRHGVARGFGIRYQRSVYHDGSLGIRYSSCYRSSFQGNARQGVVDSACRGCGYHAVLVLMERELVGSELDLKRLLDRT